MTEGVIFIVVNFIANVGGIITCHVSDNYFVNMSLLWNR